MVSEKFESNLDENQTTQVDFTDGKTSKLEAGIKLSLILTIGVFIVWSGLIGASVVESQYINSEAARELVNIITPILLTTILVSIISWLLGKSKL